MIKKYIQQQKQMDKNGQNKNNQIKEVTKANEKHVNFETDVKFLGTNQFGAISESSISRSSMEFLSGDDSLEDALELSESIEIESS